MMKVKAGPIAERSKSSDLDCGRGDPGSNPAWGHFFSGVGWRTKLKSYCLFQHMVIKYLWLNGNH